MLCFSVSLFAQKKNSKFRIHIHKTHSPIIIDGNMNDAAWQDAASVNTFYRVLPMDTGMAKVPTEVRMCFDDENIYILAICTKTLKGPDMVESLRRDFNFVKNDNFIFSLIPSMIKQVVLLLALMQLVLSGMAHFTKEERQIYTGTVNGIRL